jgi:hypothetical protein
MVGGIAVIASIVRLYALWVYAVTKDPPYDDVFVSFPRPNVAYIHLMLKEILVLSQIEVNAAIISASAPALRPLFKKGFSSSSYNQPSAYPAAYGTGGGQGSNLFSRSGRNRSNAPMELYSFGGNKRESKLVGGTRGTSEESILGADGITKTVETTIEEDFVKEQVHGHSGATQGYNGVKQSTA